MDFTLSQDTGLLVGTARELFERHNVLREVVDGAGPVRSRTKLLAEAALNLVLVPEPMGIGCELLDATMVLEQAGATLLPDPLADTMVLAAAAALAGAEGDGGDMTAAILSGQIEVAADLLSVPSVPTGAVTARVLVPWVGTPRYLAVLARTMPGSGGALLFFEVGGVGVEVGELDDTDPARPVRVCHLVNARPVATIAIADDRVAQLRRQTLILRSAELVGGASSVLAQTLQYARERTQFGRAIGSYQAVKHSFADMYASVEQARASVQMAALTTTTGMSCAERDAVAAARWVTATAVKTAGTAIHLHGGMGFAWETGLHLHLRRALSLRRVLDVIAVHDTALSLRIDSLEATV